VISGNVEAVEKLIVLGAKVSCCDEQSRSPLHYAAYNGDREMLSLLCDYDADIEAKDASVMTKTHVLLCLAASPLTLPVFVCLFDCCHLVNIVFIFIMHNTNRVTRHYMYQQLEIPAAH
jgi:hypothetical protein